VTSNYVDATDCKFLEGSTDANISRSTNGLNRKKFQLLSFPLQILKTCTGSNKRASLKKILINFSGRDSSDVCAFGK
jgi:hypothetical protein